MSRWQLYTHPIDTCTSCLAWGIIFARQLCAACYMFDRDHQVGDCRGCRRRITLTRGYCRLCWDQARTMAHVVRDRKVTAVNFIAEVREHQLFLGNMVASSRLRSGASSRRAPSASSRSPPGPQATSRRSGKTTCPTTFFKIFYSGVPRRKTWGYQRGRT